MTDLMSSIASFGRLIAVPANREDKDTADPFVALDEERKLYTGEAFGMSTMGRVLAGGGDPGELILDGELIIARLPRDLRALLEL